MSNVNGIYNSNNYMHQLNRYNLLVYKIKLLIINLRTDNNLLMKEIK